MEDSVSKRGQPFLQINYRQGVHWNRTEFLDESLENGYRALEARIGFRTLGADSWQQLCRYPKYGVGIHYADEIIGKGDTALSNPFSAFLFYQAPLLRLGRFSLNTSTSVGLSYMTLVYDPDTNPYNDIVASHINMFFDFNLNLGVELGQRIDLNLGYGVSHYSNGNIHEPQKGLNNWGWNLGMSYLFGKGQKPFQRGEFIHSEPEAFKPWEELQFMLSVGVTEWQPDHITEGIHYFAGTFVTDYAFQFSRRSAVTAGLDIMYDGALEQHIKGLSPEEVSFFQKIYLGGHIGYQLRIDRLTLLFNLGTYFVQHTYDRGFSFARAGGRLHLTDWLSAQICIKTKQGVRSDWIEWGMVYSLKTR
jgi:hypothetical protein